VTPRTIVQRGIDAAVDWHAARRAGNKRAEQNAKRRVERAVDALAASPLERMHVGIGLRALGKVLFGAGEDASS
jgi:hypothetical protein